MKTIKQTLLLCLLWTVGISASAYDFKVDGIYYNITSSSAPNTVEVTYKTDDKYNCFAYSNDITIPSSVTHNDTTYYVTSIGESAFYNCYNLTGVTVPKSVTSIGNYAFCGCHCLWGIKIPDSVTSIGEYAFHECMKINRVTIGHSVTSIGKYAFDGCSSLESITIPNSVTSIGDSAFGRCALSYIECLATTPPTLGAYSFGTDNKTIHVYKGFKSMYDAASGWHDYTIVDDIQTKKPTSIVMGSDKYFCKIGGKGTATATVLPDDATVKTITWSCDDSSVLYMVASTGEFIGLQNGVATITATAVDNPSVYATSTVYVGDFIQATSISLSEKSTMLPIAGSLTLTATVLPDNATIKTVSWCSGDTSVAMVKDGVVTPVSVGTAIITATTTDDTNLSASCTVTVVIGATSLTLDKREATIKAGESIALTPSFAPQYATIKTCNWKSSDTNIAMVNDNGIVTGIKGGKAMITATTIDGTNLTASCEIIVKDALYEVKFLDWDGTVLKSDSLSCGTTITPPENPKREGYTFVGWSPKVDATMPAKNMVYIATYTVNKYKVKYYVGGSLVHEDDVEYGAAIPKYTYKPTENRYTFEGWDGDEYETMPAHNIIYIAIISDGIEDIVQQHNDIQPIYTISGQQVTNPVKGQVYIIGGKKMLMK